MNIPYYLVEPRAQIHNWKSLKQNKNQQKTNVKSRVCMKSAGGDLMQGYITHWTSNDSVSTMV